MPTKTDILDKLDEYSAEQLAQFIVRGFVTQDEILTNPNCPRNKRESIKLALSALEEEAWEAVDKTSVGALRQFLATHPNSSHRAEAQQRIDQLQREQAAAAEEAAWRAVDKNSPDALRQFLATHPNSSHCDEARKIISDIYERQWRDSGPDSVMRELRNTQVNNHIQIIDRHLQAGDITKADILKMIGKDHNILEKNAVNELIRKHYFTKDDLARIGVDRSFIISLGKEYEIPKFDTPAPLTSIDKVCTEVYFWGVPSSGKTCAIGAILVAANDGITAKCMMQDNTCQGYGYMNRLSQIFSNRDRVCILPAGTPTANTYAMSFDLVAKDEKKHPITLVDLAGEIIEIMFKTDANEHVTDDQAQVLGQMTDLLVDNRSKNRKIHFFVIDYGAEERMFKGMTQDKFLDAAMNYIKGYGIFRKDTDAIFLCVTKVDKIGAADDDALYTAVGEYVRNSYQNLYNCLKKICEDHEINDGVVECIPFSLGEVCFKNCCLYDKKYAANVVQLLLDNTKGFKRGKFGKIIGGLSE